MHFVKPIQGNVLGNSSIVNHNATMGDYNVYLQTLKAVHEWLDYEAMRKW